eukprot:TRINITY_DN1744_c0_g1_i7.p3 TRINITY_DN1744_c0_g1~~TRINITY_DN1744_c0_g1_i7.p3  ORF type:complete len:103 (+),score=1.75 TRINITY_DN1744_c0_g1_i7:890-1198(+)
MKNNIIALATNRDEGELNTQVPITKTHLSLKYCEMSPFFKMFSRIPFVIPKHVNALKIFPTVWKRLNIKSKNFHLFETKVKLIFNTLKDYKSFQKNKTYSNT